MDTRSPYTPLEEATSEFYSSKKLADGSLLLEDRAGSAHYVSRMDDAYGRHTRGLAHIPGDDEVSFNRNLEMYSTLLRYKKRYDTLEKGL